MPGDDILRIVHIYPTVLGLYGDRGNALILRTRAERRNIAAEIISVAPGDAVPTTGDLYLIGGGEDMAQTTATDLLRADGGLAKVVAAGRVVFAVCAGMQVLGHSFSAASGIVEGLGLVDVCTRSGASRAVGELLVTDVALPVGDLTGYENHQGRTSVGSAARPLGRVGAGVGNGDGSEGVVQGHVVGTYLHGPVLARNPQLADLLLGWAAGSDLVPLDDPTAEALRAERLHAVRVDPTAATPEQSGSPLSRLRARLSRRSA